eukprot:6068956-Pyramimonas_sp.AAC.1
MPKELPRSGKWAARRRSVPQWRPFGASWGPLGGPGRTLERLGCLDCILGPLDGSVGSLLEASWAPVGASWGLLGALGLVYPKIWNEFGLFGASWGGFWPLGAVLEWLLGLLEHRGSHLEESWGIS